MVHGVCCGLYFAFFYVVLILRIACAQIGEQCLRADLDSVSLVLALAALYKCAEKRKAVLKPDVAPFVRSFG
jgi:hypothetical protein